MALIKCDECGKEISSKAKTCIHCGNPIEKSNKTNNNLEYKSFYDLSMNEREKLKEQFKARIEKSGERKICTVLLVVSIIYVLIYGAGFFSTIDEMPILENWFFWEFLFWILGCVISCIQLDKDTKNIEQQFVTWLDSSKHIKK